MAQYVDMDFTVFLVHKRMECSVKVETVSKADPTALCS